MSQTLLAGLQQNLLGNKWRLQVAWTRPFLVSLLNYRYWRLQVWAHLCLGPLWPLRCAYVAVPPTQHRQRICPSSTQSRQQFICFSLIGRNSFGWPGQLPQPNRRQALPTWHLQTANHATWWDGVTSLNNTFFKSRRVNCSFGWGCLVRQAFILNA